MTERRDFSIQAVYCRLQIQRQIDPSIEHNLHGRLYDELDAIFFHEIIVPMCGQAELELLRQL